MRTFFPCPADGLLTSTWRGIMATLPSWPGPDVRLAAQPTEHRFLTEKGRVHCETQTLDNRREPAVGGLSDRLWTCRRVGGAKHTGSRPAGLWGSTHAYPPAHDAGNLHALAHCDTNTHSGANPAAHDYADATPQSHHTPQDHRTYQAD